MKIEFISVLFGLNASLAAIIKCFELALGPDVGQFCSIFVDDILVISESFEEHL